MGGCDPSFGDGPAGIMLGFLLARAGIDVLVLEKEKLQVRCCIAGGIAPFLHDRVSELNDFSDLKLLSVRVDRLQQWYRPGLLCIGDAAHAMSPIGGVGINLAIQDAIAAANVLVRPFCEGALTVDDLAKVQRRRALPTRLTQGFQVVIQKQVIARVLATPKRVEIPWPLRRVLHSKFLSRIRGRIVGIGFRPEHVKTPDVLA